MNTSVKINNLRLELDDPEETLPTRAAGRLGLGPDSVLRWRILRKSLDARRADDLHFSYAMELELPADAAERALAASARAGLAVQPYLAESFDWPGSGPDARPLDHRPVVIGAGPAGLIAGYLLALNGYRPLVLERGRAVKDRVADVRRFDSGGAIDPESNYLFGEGGAGTFSDGKLTSRSGGPDVHRVLEILADCHGKPSILYEHRPHLGSNRLPLIVRTLRKKLEDLGGEVRFSCRVEDLDFADGRLRGLGTSSGYIAADAAVLAVGHSARDTYDMLLRRGVPLLAKPFQFGVRIEQPQEQINKAQHGPREGHPALGAADYGLSVRAGGCDLFTFCMCAGGYVMPSVSEPGYFSSNGMSESRHDSPFANSGLVVTIDPAETSSHPLAGVHFQQRYERAAYVAGGRSYAAPIQWARDFLNGRASKGTLPSSYTRSATRAMDLGPLLPEKVARALLKGLPIMDRRLDRRFLRDATLTGPESRGSSPVRIPRDPDSRQSPAVAGLYPCGEGAGYAGGIVSAAVDGLRTARSLVAAFAPPR
ncbi:NAD(P)/FAD-dependent oxidoreductase [Paludisphaera soli]|uniref:NAD(P)/FAD-dependent oxidoreductase n=1 Tax=Paludisphaera soli TaxID=2712865 RepID=UPI0013EB5BAA|nr:NAD(P)-binding protein [Paludisphaera soli]